MLTLIFAVAVAGILIALFSVGALSDQIGRSPVLVAGVVLTALGSAAFVLSQGVAWLFVARIFQGLAVGVVTGAATAAMGELEPSGNHERASLLAAAATVGGMSSGALFSGLLVQYAPWPTRLVYLIQLILLVIALIGVVSIPETVKTSDRSHWQPQRLAIPAQIRKPFWLASAVVFGSFAVVGLFQSLGPSFTVRGLHIDNKAIGGLVVFAMLGTSAGAQLACRRWAIRRALVAGSVLLTVGIALIVLALRPPSLAMLLVGSIVAGVGQALTYHGSQELVDRIAPVGERAEVFSAFSVMLYLANALPALGVGFGITLLGFYGATLTFGVLIGLLTILTGAISATRLLPAPATKLKS